MCDRCSFHHPDRKALGVAQDLIGHPAAEEAFDARGPMPSHDDRVMVSAFSFFENVACNIFFMTDAQRDPASLDARLRQGLTGFDENRTLGFGFLSNPRSLVVALLS